VKRAKARCLSAIRSSTTIVRQAVPSASSSAESLNKFRNSEGWKVGIDGSVALIDLGAGKTIDSKNIKDPVVGFIFGSKGLMYNLTLEGTKIHKLDKS
jgi:lipid-binding SYLF domain-containing protein